MSLFMYLLAIGVWVGVVEFALHQRRQHEYRRIQIMRSQAEALLREARLARLRATVSLHRPAARARYEQRAS